MHVPACFIQSRHEIHTLMAVLSCEFMAILVAVSLNLDNSCLPCPPGYMHRKMFPSSSAWMRPDGVSSPPHFRISKRDASRGVSAVGITVLGFRLPLRKCRQNKLQLTLLPSPALLGCILNFPYFRDGNRNPSTVVLIFCH